MYEPSAGPVVGHEHDRCQPSSAPRCWGVADSLARLASLAFAITPPLGAANAAEPSPSEQPPSAQGDQPATSPTSDAPVPRRPLQPELAPRRWIQGAQATALPQVVLHPASQDCLPQIRPGSNPHKAKSFDYLACSRSKRRWVTIPYSWNARRGLLQFDASKRHVAQPKSGSHRVWRYTRSKWKLRSGTTKCQIGRTQRVTARFFGPNSAAHICSPTKRKYVSSPYGWKRRVGRPRQLGHRPPELGSG